ncbi:MAG: amino acid dehydrogenase [Flavobacteriales bacterium]|nr:amino acid dehydrogenase [Flavobacteriales bacterium]MCX7767931.1 amino acid dehydrogenase [Flavobacteriales bacterium]MDW8409335.1 Glu/Leu/Phe/Val dehydrogenase dimerization domain-containing protein [Flavobacteriales bacterium]
MRALLEKFENAPPEIVLEWHDSETEAVGWVVINSLRGGAAGGGTRMRKGLDRREVESLAKTMEIKFTVAGPPIGGGKSGINFDPTDPRKEGVLKRWFKTVLPLLKSYYGTGGDLNVDEIHEVIPITTELGLLHPQEGVLNGHFRPSGAERTRLVERLQKGVSLVLRSSQFSPNPEGQYTVADMITGFGVAEAVKHYYSLWGGHWEGKRALVQGWGNVGAAAAFFLAKSGVRIVGIMDRGGGLLKPEGFSESEVKALFLSREGNRLRAPELIPYEVISHDFWTIGADIFLPCAASRLLTHAQCEQLIRHGLEVISCGANVPFADEEIFFGPTAEYADRQVSVIPDFMANCGMARVFAFLMSDAGPLEEKAIFEDTSHTIRRALEEVHALNPSRTGIVKTSYELALKRLVNSPAECFK